MCIYYSTFQRPKRVLSKYFLFLFLDKRYSTAFPLLWSLDEYDTEVREMMVKGMLHHSKSLTMWQMLITETIRTVPQEIIDLLPSLHGTIWWTFGSISLIINCNLQSNAVQKYIIIIYEFYDKQQRHPRYKSNTITAIKCAYNCLSPQPHPLSPINFFYKN